MTTFLNIGGKQRPIRYGMAALLYYEQTTGRNSLQDFARLQEQQASITLMVDLLYCGLLNGHKHERMEVDFDQFTVAEWIGEDMSLMEQAMKAFAASFPNSGQDAGAEQKKTANLRVSRKTV